MAIQALLPYLAAAYGGYKGYQGAKDSGASGLQRILGGLTGAYTGYTLGNMVPGTVPYSQLGQNFPVLKGLPGQAARAVVPSPMVGAGEGNPQGSLLDILRKGGESGADFSGGRVSAAIAAGTYLSGAFDPGPTDIFMPGYNMSYLDLK